MMLDFEVEGWPVWIDQSPRVAFSAKTRKSKSAEALERAQWQEQKKAEKAKNYVPNFGARYYAVPTTMDGGPMPTKREWIKEQQEKIEAGRMKLSSGKVVKTAADPEKMALYRNKKVPRKSAD